MQLLSRFVLAVTLTLTPLPGLAQQQPGDFGYRHDEYHRRGLIDDLERRAGQSCCGGHGECRATYVDLTERKALIDGRWCPIGYRTALRYDLELPDNFAMVCAGRSLPSPYPCPAIYCIAVAPGG